MKKCILPVLPAIVSYGILGYVLYTLYYISHNSQDKDAWVIPILFTVTTYLITGVALTLLARSVKPSLIWMAWIPFARLYLLGALADLYTDNRMAPGKARRPSRRRPSKLRYLLPWLRAGNVVTEAISFVLLPFFLIFCLVPLLFLSETIRNGEDFSYPVDLTILIPRYTVIFGGTWLFLTVVVVSLILGGLAIFCRGVTLHRLYRALWLPCAPLWAIVSVPNPFLTALLFLIYAIRTKDRAERFLPSAEEVEERPS